MSLISIIDEFLLRDNTSASVNQDLPPAIGMDLLELSFP